MRKLAVGATLLGALVAASPGAAHHPPPSLSGPVFGAPWTLAAKGTPVARAEAGERWPANVAKANCGPGSLPETGLQGEVPLADQASGRSARGYRCNLELVGQYAGDGAAIMMAWHGDCAYMATGYPPWDPEFERSKGVVVVDATNPAAPVPTARLQTPAMYNPWEALKANAARGLLASGEGGSFPVAGPGSPGPHFDVYDVGTDCRHPKLLASTKLPNAKGHEGDWAPDGRTYYQSTMSRAPEPSIVAIDVADPRQPRELGAYPSPVVSPVHGLEIGPDGNRAYVMTSAGPSNPGGFNGLLIFDTSEVQSRRPNPRIHLLGKVGWDDNVLSQIGRYVRIGGHPYVITTDEFGAATTSREACDAGRPPYGYLHVVDVADERSPRVVSTMRMEVNDPAHCARTQSEQTAALPLMYSSHYCNADDPQDTTAIACTWLSSGLRVFDVRDPRRPREIAYYNSGGRSDTGRANTPFFEVLLGSRTKDAQSSAVRWRRAADGRQELWTMSALGGVQILRFANGAYPLRDPAPGARAGCLTRGAPASRRSLGPVRLGRRRSAQRAVLRSARLRARGGLDTWCVDGGGSLRAGYPTARLRRTQSLSQRRRTTGRVVLVIASSRRFAVRGVRPGARFATLRRRVRGLRRQVIGGNAWFTRTGRGARLVFRARGGRVREVGVADLGLTRTPAAQRRFLRSFSRR
jgi:hypothetical protein